MDNEDLILIVEDDADLREAICDTLRMANFNVVEAQDAKSALTTISLHAIKLIISDVQMPGMDGHELLKVVKQKYSDIPFVLITAYGTVPQAVEAIQYGAADYIAKPFEAEVLIEMVNRFIVPTINTDSMVIEDESSKALATLAAKVADTDVTVMISGESGCGKEVYSKFIHESSSRSKQPFIAINCAAIPESMLESILFGYEKGAFTGAYTARAGKFEQANNGTLLLDEISEMDLGLQAKLLRVIQEKEVERLGANKTIPLNVRLIATTNKSLRSEVVGGRFREDLFYRLNVFPLHLAPLRERQGDILPLAQKFIRHYQPGQGTRLNTEAKKMLVEHSWAGNVRELENVIQRALILKTGVYITPVDIILEDSTQIVQTRPYETVEIADSNNPSQLGDDLKTREKEIIINAVAAHVSRKEAAEKLGISQRTLRYKLAKFRQDGIHVPSLAETASA